MLTVANNLPALNAHNNLNRTNLARSKTIKKLSSGKRINTAVDDAAGLTISSKIKSQIRGMERVQDNVQNGISLIQTMEGGMVEITSMLQRQRELVVQALNDTCTDEDRNAIQLEIIQLIDEIDHIANQTEYNTIKVLLGEGTGGTDGSGGSVGGSDSLFGSNMEILNTLTGGIASYKVSNHGLTFDGDPVIMHGSSAGKDLGWPGGGNYTVLPPNVITLRRSWESSKIDGTTIALILERDANKNWYLSAGNEYSNNSPTAISNGNTYVLNHNSGDPDLDLRLEIGGTILDIINSNANPNAISGRITLNIEVIGPPAGGTISYAADQWPSWGSNFETLVESKDTDMNLKFNYSKASSGTNNVNGWTVSATGLKGYSVSGFDGRYVTLSDGSNSFSVDIGKTLEEPTDTDIESGYFELYTYVSSGANIPIIDFFVVDVGGKISTIKTPETSPDKTSLWIQVGANSGQGMWVDLSDCRSETLGVNNISVIKPQLYNALDSIDDAIEQINKYRVRCGAQQNRLEHAFSYAGISEESLESANSRIEDVDMAKEYVEYAKTNILEQAGNAILAQAMRNPEGVLQLLA